MTSRDALKPMDRAVLQTWRIGNIIGWSLGALIVAIAMNFAASILIDDILDAAVDPITGGAVVPYAISGAITAILVGGSAGAVVGSRVVARPLVVSVVVVLIYLAVWPFALLGLGLSGVWIALAIVAHVASAVAAARLMARRRAS